jgi:ferric-dicitrate binding protein FerR (iron transport regulator)
MIAPEDRDRLFADFLAGELDPEGMERLEAVLREDPAARRELAALQDIDVLGEALGRSPGHREEFADRLMVSLSDPERRDQLTEAVLRDVREDRSCARPALSRWRRRDFSRRSPVRAWAVASVALCAAAAAVSWYAFRDKARPVQALVVLREASSKVQVRRGSAVFEGHGGMSLLAQDAVEVGPAGSAVIVYSDSTRLDLGAEGVLHLSSGAAAGRRAHLARGTLEVAASKQPPGRSMAIMTPDAEVRIIGTRFTLRVKPEFTRVEVREGEVLCVRRADGANVRVGADRYAIVGEGRALVASPMAEEEALAGLPPGSKILFREGFREPPGEAWTGERRPAPNSLSGEYALSSVAAEPPDGAAFFALLWTPWHEPGWPVGKHTYLRFRYLTEGFSDRQGLKLMAKKKDQTNWSAFLDAPTLGRWETVTVRVGDFISALGAPNPPQEGSTLHQFIWYGYCYKSAPPRGARLWIDDVVLFEAPGDVPAQRLSPAAAK